MKGKYYTIQIIPEDSKEIKKYRVSTRWWLFLKIFLVLLIIASGVLIYNAGRIGKIVVQYETMRTANAQLAKQNANYEELFSRIDSLWVLEERIQNILGTFIENDSNKINSLIDKNRFAHTPSEKINVDYEGIHGWKSMEERSRLEHIPNVIPVVGIVSKKFSEENDHLGTDFSAQSGDPVLRRVAASWNLPARKTNWETRSSSTTRTAMSQAILTSRISAPARGALSARVKS